MANSNYTADAHVAQMNILHHLLLTRTAHFADLAHACALSNDHASFHIKQLVTNGLIEHVPKVYGEYRLTRDGKEYANRMDTDEKVIEKQPKLSVVLVIENEKGEHLQQERLKQPYFGYWGHPTGKIRWGETIEETAARELLEETGLTADLRPLGFYHKMDYDENGELLEDKYLCLVHGTHPKGTMLEISDGQRNAWLSDEEFMTKEKRFGSAIETTEIIKNGKMFLKEKKYQYKKEDY